MMVAQRDWTELLAIMTRRGILVKFLMQVILDRLPPEIRSAKTREDSSGLASHIMTEDHGVVDEMDAGSLVG